MKILLSDTHQPAINLATEEYLLTERKEDFLFFYINATSVIIGSHQSISLEVNQDFCKAENIPVIRRKSGGGAVYHDLGNLNYSIIKNKEKGKSVLDADFLFPVILALHALNIPVVLGNRNDLWLPGGNKISGTASRAIRNRELHHGTMLYDANLKFLHQTLTANPALKNIKAVHSVRSQVKNIRTYLQELNVKTQDSQVFFDEFISTFLTDDVENQPFYLSDEEKDIILEKYLPVYNSEEWTYKL